MLSEGQYESSLIHMEGFPHTNLTNVKWHYMLGTINAKKGVT
jgi:hypothetical protein